MDVDQDPQEQGTSPRTPFDDGFPPSTTRLNASADHTSGVHTKHFFTSIFTESQETDHTNVNTNQQPLTPEATRDAKPAVATAQLIEYRYDH